MQTNATATFVCPSRRGVSVGPIGDNHIWNVDTAQFAISGATRSDYVRNRGTAPTGIDGGPTAGSDTNTAFDIAGYFRSLANWKLNNGVIYNGSALAIKKIPDGLSKTYLLGEKALQPRHYDPGFSSDKSQRNYADDQSRAFLCDRGIDWILRERAKLFMILRLSLVSPQIMDISGSS